MLVFVLGLICMSATPDCSVESFTVQYPGYFHFRTSGQWLLPAWGLSLHCRDVTF